MTFGALMMAGTWRNGGFVRALAWSGLNLAMFVGVPVWGCFVA